MNAIAEKINPEDYILSVLFPEDRSELFPKKNKWFVYNFALIP